MLKIHNEIMEGLIAFGQRNLSRISVPRNIKTLKGCVGANGIADSDYYIWTRRK